MGNSNAQLKFNNCLLAQFILHYNYFNLLCSTATLWAQPLLLGETEGKEALLAGYHCTYTACPCKLLQWYKVGCHLGMREHYLIQFAQMKVNHWLLSVDVACLLWILNISLLFLPTADDRDLSKLETLVWNPENRLSEREIDQFLVVAR